MSDNNEIRKVLNEINWGSSTKNAQRMTEILHNAGLPGVTVEYGYGRLYRIRGGKYIDGTDDVVDAEGVVLSMGHGNRVIISDLEPQSRAAVVRVYHYATYASNWYYKHGIALLITADDAGLSVRRVPWSVEGVREAREFTARYRFYNHSVGASRERRLANKPYYDIELMEALQEWRKSIAELENITPRTREISEELRRQKREVRKVEKKIKKPKRYTA